MRLVKLEIYNLAITPKTAGDKWRNIYKQCGRQSVNKDLCLFEKENNIANFNKKLIFLINHK